MYNIGEITIEVLITIMEQLIRGKTPEPDEIPTGVLKEMSETNHNRIKEL
jgi:hypothetical protein